MERRDRASPNFVANGAHLLRTGKFSDLTLICQEQEFLVHKAIVCMRSPVLAAATEGLFKEAETITVEVCVADAQTLQRALAYLYTGEYDDETLPSINYLLLPALERQLVLAEPNDEANNSNDDHSQPANSNDRLLANTRAYILADYYQIPELQDLAVEKFKASLKNFNQDGFLDVCRLVYTSTPSTADELRLALIVAVGEHADDLIEDAQFVSEVIQFPDLIRAAFVHVVQQNQITSADKTVAIARCAETEKALEESKSKAKAAQKQADRKFDALVSEVNNAASRCRHCKLENNVHLEEGTGHFGDPGYSLRCKCRTRY